MEVVFVALEINEMLGDKIQMTKSSFKVSLLEERFGGLDDVPVILKFIQAGLVSHEEPQNSLSELWLLASHDILDADIVHIPVSQVSLSGLVDSF